MLSKAASGIASTTTTMATTLDEAMENFFEGWTPAPPAADHTPFHSSSYYRYQNHSNSAAHWSTGKRALSGVQSAHHAEVAAQSNQNKGANDDWDEWESPFQSKSCSPNIENENPNDSRRAGSGISAWHAHSPGCRDCEAERDVLWGAATCQKHRDGVVDTCHHAFKRYSPSNIEIIGLSPATMLIMQSCRLLGSHLSFGHLVREAATLHAFASAML